MTQPRLALTVNAAARREVIEARCAHDVGYILGRQSLQLALEMRDLSVRGLAKDVDSRWTAR